MELHRGSFRERYSHPDIVVRAEIAHRSGAEWILSDLEEQIRSGTVFRVGDTVQIGWMTVLLKDLDGGDLELFEPEFGSMPVNWVPGANNTIRQMIIQKELCEQIGVGAYYPSMRQSAVVSPNFMKTDQGFELSRDASKGNDSGWVFREGGYAGSSGTLFSLYQIAISIPAIIPFLALPSGAIVTSDRMALEVSANGAKISSSDNDFLMRLLGSVYFRR